MPGVLINSFHSILRQCSFKALFQVSDLCSQIITVSSVLTVTVCSCHSPYSHYFSLSPENHLRPEGTAIVTQKPGAALRRGFWEMMPKRRKQRQWSLVYEQRCAFEKVAHGATGPTEVWPLLTRSTLFLLWQFHVPDFIQFWLISCLYLSFVSLFQ